MTEVDWTGGQIEVTAASGGWCLEHRLRNGSAMPLDWQSTKTEAVAAGIRYAFDRKALLLVEQKV